MPPVSKSLTTDSASPKSLAPSSRERKPCGPAPTAMSARSGCVQVARNLSALPCRRRAVSWLRCPLRLGMALGRRLALASPRGGGFLADQCARSEPEHARPFALGLQQEIKTLRNTMAFAEDRDRHRVALAIVGIVVRRCRLRRARAPGLARLRRAGVGGDLLGDRWPLRCGRRGSLARLGRWRLLLMGDRCGGGQQFGAAALGGHVLRSSV